MQDLVILATLAPKDTASLQTSISGIGISPTNSDYAFDMTKSDGTHITREDLKNRNVYDETFSANNVVMRTKNGDGSSITVGSESVSLDGRDVTINAASSGSLKLKVWNNNKGLGNWYIQLLEGSTGNVTTGGETTPPTGGGTSPSTKTVVGVGVNVEISWPLHQTDYNKRTKLRYYFEVYDLKNIGASTSS